MKTSLKSFNLTRILHKLLIVVLLGVLGNILLSLYTVDKEIVFTLTNFSPGYFLLAIFLTLIPWVTHALRLIIWTKLIGKPLSLINSFKIVLGAELGAAISPTAVGGAPVKIGMLVQLGGFNTGVATSLTSLGSLEDNLFAFIAVPIALTLSSSWKLPIFKSIFHKFYGSAIYVVLFLVFIAISLLIFHKIRIKKRAHFITELSLYQKILKYVQSFWNDFKSVYYLIIKKGKARFIISMILTTIQWTTRYSVISALLASLNIPVEPVRFFALQWVVFTLMNFIPTPGATAGAEAAFYFIYQTFFPNKIIGLITAGWRFLTFYFLIILGIVLLIILNTPNHLFKRVLKRQRQPAIRPRPLSMTTE